MNRYLLAAIVFVLCASQAFAWDVKVGKSTIDVKDECVVIDINAKTQVKVCKCGSVAVQEWKEVVKNKDDRTLFISSGTPMSNYLTAKCLGWVNGEWKETDCQ